MNWQAARDTLLAELVRHPRLGLVTDMDGTLSPIAPTPDAAQLTPRNRDLLDQLSRHLTLVAVVSGRAVSDLRRRVGLEYLTYVGNHGLEQWTDGRVEVAPEALAYRDALVAALTEVEAHLLPGMRVEDKDATASIHYRQTADPEVVKAELGPVVEAIANRHGLRFFGGRMIFEIRPPIHIDKGTAFQRLIDEFRLDAAVFIGDDTTDADALMVAQQLRAARACYSLGVGVLAAETPAVVRDSADVFVDGVSGVESFLAWLLSARVASAT